MLLMASSANNVSSALRLLSSRIKLNISKSGFLIQIS
jgi:hypothetical protein